MTVELERFESSGPPEEDLGRTPPQDVAAEQSVLGGMMLSKDAIADVVEQVRGVDFYRPAHELVFDAVLDLYGRGEPADAVTVAAELTKRGQLGRVGGAAYLHTLITSVPTAANAGYYAEIVRERAVLRRLVEAGTRIVQLGYAASGGDVDDIVNTAQAEVYAVTEKRTSEDYVPLAEVIEGTIDEIEASSHRGGAMVGVPTGFADLDQLTNGLHPGQMVVIAARPAIGKALALDTPLPSPTGWTTMGDVAVGDQLLAADGTPTTVVGATEVMTDRPCYRVTFDDGTTVVADAHHQWLTDARAGRPGQAGPAVRTTQEIGSTLRCGTADPRPNHSVQNTRPLRLPEQELLIPPYVLGAWLGDGASRADRVATGDAEILMRVDAEAPDAGELPALLSSLAVLGDKHVPLRYLRASEEQRRRLLAGLLDTGGTVDSRGSVRFRMTNQRLAEGFVELLMSLGYRCGVSRRTVRGRREEASACYAVTFSTSDVVFGISRKQIAHKERTTSHQAVAHRFIVDVQAIDPVPVRCVQVDHPDHLYLATRAMVPTHNSTVGLDIARSAAIKHGLTSVIFSLEMGRNEITMRLLSAEATVSLQHMRKGTMREEDWTRLARTMGRVSEAPLFIDDSPNMSLMEIRAKCRRLKQRHDLKLVVIDYLQLMSSGKRVESRQQEVSEFSRALKLLAKELELPVIAISQLNRGPEQRTDKKPQLSDLRESGSIEQDADVVILLHREDAYERESPRAGEADFIVAKHRNGPTDTITVAFQGHYSRFVDMAQGA
ncbi:MAG: replicative DNA helicase [Actinomycetes bacterium]